MMAIDWAQVTRRRPLRVILRMWHTDSPWASSPNSRKPHVLRCWLEVGNNGAMYASRIEHEPMPFMSEKAFTHLTRPLRVLLSEITGREIKPFQAGVFVDIGPVGEWPLCLPAEWEGPLFDYFQIPEAEKRSAITA